MGQQSIRQRNCKIDQKVLWIDIIEGVRKIILALTLMTMLPNAAKSFGILDDISQDTTISDLITENILAISPSKRIFVISNENRSFSKGDFISLVYNTQLTARAIVAKALKMAQA